jgi:hypothetical protein
LALLAQMALWKERGLVLLLVAQAGFVGALAALDVELPVGPRGGGLELDLVALGLARVEQGLDFGQLKRPEGLPGVGIEGRRGLAGRGSGMRASRVPAPGRG